jgi:hypothetical protein
MLSVVALVGEDQIDLVDSADLAILIYELTRKRDPSFRLIIDGKAFRTTYLHTLNDRRVED